MKPAKAPVRIRTSMGAVREVVLGREIKRNAFILEKRLRIFA
jgi:hypothetical protein